MVPMESPKGNGGYNQPKNYEEREEVATACKTKLQLEMPFVIDTMDSQADSQYNGWPERIYIINKDGKVHFIGDPGPAGFHPEKAETSLKQLL